MLRHSLYDSMAQRKAKWELYKNDADFIENQNELLEIVLPGTMRDYYRSYIQKSSDVMTGSIRRVTRGSVCPGQLAGAKQWCIDVSNLRKKIIGKDQTIAFSLYGLQTLTSQTEFASWEA